MRDQTHSQVLIVGAGIAGLLAAHRLHSAGVRTVVAEREMLPGGRMATRSIGPGRADHGAQFFTVRTPEFQQWVDQWIAKGLVFEWAQGWSDGSFDSAPTDGHPRYAVRGGMQALALHLAGGLPDVRLRTNLTVIAPHARGWLAIDDRGRVLTATALLVTPPVPMVLPLLRAGGIALNTTGSSALSAITYAPCLAGIFWVNGTVNLPDPGAIQQHNAAINWIADNQRKGISPEATVITVHAGPSYSRDLWLCADWEILAALEAGLRRFKEIDAQIVEKTLVRWRYAMPLVTHPQPYLLAQGQPALVFAGDAFGGPRIEGAARSGLAAAEALAALLG